MTKPIEDDDDYFYSEANLAHLDHSLAQIKNGQVVEHDIIEVTDEDIEDIQTAGEEFKNGETVSRENIDRN